MRDRWVIAMAVAAAAGALHPAGVPLLVGASMGLVALRLRWPVVLCVGVGLCASTLADRALDGLAGLEEGLVHGQVLLVGDPRPQGSGVRAEARVDGRRVELRAAGTAAAALAQRLAGEVVDVRGRIAPLPQPAPWLLARHIGARLTVSAVAGWSPGDALSRVANGLRRNLERGAEPLDPTQRSLYTGLVVGDDRAQPATLRDDFLGAGLTHLVAVSGQNVAFCLVLASPLLRRLRLWPRWIATLGVIGLFGVVTRFEASVLRASAMAAVATTVVTIGRPVSRVRIIGLATTGLLLVDPLLVHSVGFRLSLAAAAGIVVLAGPLASVLPGPRMVRDAVSVTVAAQLGVAPVLLATFGPMPVATLPANLLAVPVAGLVMVWGMTAGMVAGALGEPLASVLHVPTRFALGWLEVVADRASAAPLGELGVAHTLVAGAALAGALAAHRAGPAMRHRRVAAITRRRSWWLVVAGLAVAAATVRAQAPAPLRADLMVGLVRWHAAGDDVVVLGGAGGRSSLGAPGVLEALRREGLGAVDLLVVADANVPEATLAALAAAHPVGAVVTHRQAAAGAEAALERPVERAPPVDTTVELRHLAVRLVPGDDRVVVDARRR